MQMVSYKSVEARHPLASSTTNDLLTGSIVVAGWLVASAIIAAWLTCVSWLVQVPSANATGVPLSWSSEMQSTTNSGALKSDRLDRANVTRSKMEIAGGSRKIPIGCEAVARDNIPVRCLT
jgi:hypothetical protein